jgi:hypothetical protein
MQDTPGSVRPPDVPADLQLANAYETAGPVAAARAGIPAFSETGERFAYHRHELPMILLLASFALVELFLMHLLLSLWSNTAALIASALTLAAFLHMTMLVRAMIRRPILVDAHNVRVRCGIATEVLVPIASITRLEDSRFAPEPRGPGVFRATLLAHPNLTMHLAPPVPMKKGARVFLIHRLALRLDEAEAFCKLVAARRQTGTEAASSSRSGATG